MQNVFFLLMSLISVPEYLCVNWLMNRSIIESNDLYCEIEALVFDNHIVIRCLICNAENNKFNYKISSITEVVIIKV